MESPLNKTTATCPALPDVKNQCLPIKNKIETWSHRLRVVVPCPPPPPPPPLEARGEKVGAVQGEAHQCPPAGLLAEKSLKIRRKIHLKNPPYNIF